jgi:hypothetical protein
MKEFPHPQSGPYLLVLQRRMPAPRSPLAWLVSSFLSRYAQVISLGLGITIPRGFVPTLNSNADADANTHTNADAHL